MLAFFAIYLLIGAFAGIVAGLLGVGGGLIIVPVLAVVFQHQGIAPALIMHLALGTSLATIVMTSIASVRSHHLHGAVLWPTFIKLTPGIVLGALLGAAVADQMQSNMLRVIFAFFELLVAMQLALDVKPKPNRQLPSSIGLIPVGAVIGMISAIVGIGGGTMTVPYLTWCNVAMRKAVATSSACGLPIAIAGGIGYFLAGWNELNLPNYSSGYIFWPAFAGITMASVMFAPLGASWAHRLPAKTLKRIFAIFLAILGLGMLTT